MNDLETQLRSWAPRRPSARLKARIFATRATRLQGANSARTVPDLYGPAVAVARSLMSHLAGLFATRRTGTLHPETPAFRLSWLAPAGFSLLLMCILFNQRNAPALSGSTPSSPMVAMILSNQSAAAYLPASFQHEQNRVPADTLEWTNGRGSTSSIPSLSAPKASPKR